MTVINGSELWSRSPIKDMEWIKKKEHGVSYGLSEAGYDIRIKQEILFSPNYQGNGPAIREVDEDGNIIRISEGRFTLASAIEEFDMPDDLVGIVHDKSTWARQGLSVFNTVVEPSWKGFLTLELVFHGNKEVVIPAGAGIAQVVFSSLVQRAYYAGKYQNQEDRPIDSVFEK